MTDITDIQDTFESHLFKVACQDAVRIVSILSIESDDIVLKNKSFSTKAYEKSMFFMRFFYLVFLKGFTPPVFDMIPYRLWQVISISIYLYRLSILPLWLRLMSYQKYTSWTEPPLGTYQPPLPPITKTSKSQSPSKQKSKTKAKDKADVSTSTTTTSTTTIVPLKEDRLAVINFNDPKYEYLIEMLYKKQAHLSPHSQSPGHPFHMGFPGNFLDHLIGVHKILSAWKQPQYIARAGMFHSVYGTFDYRASFFDLRHGRAELQSIIGSASEEIAFLICTSDRLGLMRDMLKVLYGPQIKSMLGGGISSNIDGNPYPPRLNIHLTADGYPLRNHITQQIHIIPSDLFAQFIIVMIADFMEQGALGAGSDDADICLFQFLRYRFYNDLILFIQPYLRIVPPVWMKYMGTTDFTEPFRYEVILIKKLWGTKICPLIKILSSNKIKNTTTNTTTTTPSTTSTTNITASAVISLNKTDQEKLVHICMKYPYLLEPRMILGLSLSSSQTYEKFTRNELLHSALTLVEEWGMMTIKGTCTLKDIIHLCQYYLQD